jgi:uncharacterized protein YjbI with pentapeptide repeats
MDMNTKSMLRTGALALAGIIMAVFLVRAIVASSSRCDWTGFGPCQATMPGETQQQYRAKTLWDWLQLLIVPVVLVFGGALFARAQAASALRLAEDDQREQALQRFLDKIGQSIVAGNLKPAPISEPTPGSEGERIIRVNLAARARTRTLLMRLDGARKGETIRFLAELHLISGTNCVIPLSDADLQNAHLAGLYLKQVSFGGANLTSANLQNSYLGETNFNRAKMRGANLSGADIPQAELQGADLTKATVEGATMAGCLADGIKFESARLKRVKFVDLSMRDEDGNPVVKRMSLAGADFSKAVIENVEFSGAWLPLAKFTKARLSHVRFVRSDVTNADFTGTVFTDVTFDQCEGNPPPRPQRQIKKRESKRFRQ